MLKRNDELREKAEKYGDLAYNLKVSIEENYKLSANSEREFYANKTKIDESLKSLSSDNNYNHGKKRFMKLVINFSVRKT